jgi:hypothetical protein
MVQCFDRYFFHCAADNLETRLSISFLTGITCFKDLYAGRITVHLLSFTTIDSSSNLPIIYVVLLLVNATTHRVDRYSMGTVLSLRRT